MMKPGSKYRIKVRHEGDYALVFVRFQKDIDGDTMAVFELFDGEDIDTVEFNVTEILTFQELN